MIDRQGQYEAYGSNDEKPSQSAEDFASEFYYEREKPEASPKLVYLEAMVECPGEPEIISAELKIAEEANA